MDEELERIKRKKLKQMMKGAGAEIKIYTTSTCPYCELAKDYLSKRGLKFREINVELNHAAAMEMINKSGQTGVPVIDINGKIIVGFDRQAIDNALKG